MKNNTARVDADGPGAESARAPRVLIVEDEAIVAADLQHTVNALGYDAFATAASGADALRHAQHTTPDVVLMDIHIEGHMCGIETAQMLREQCDASIVFLTAHADEPTIERARKSRPSGYLLKPVTAPALKAAIGLALDARNRDHWSRVREMTLNLRAAELGDVLDSVTSAVLVETPELQIRHINRPFGLMFGLGDKFVPASGTDSEWLMQSIGAQAVDYSSFTTLVASLRRMRQPATCDLIRLIDGRVLERDYVPLFKGEAFRGHLWAYRDVSEREREHLAVVESAAKARPSTLIDVLTGLNNRQGFHDLADGFLRFLRRNQQRKMLFYFGLDDIKAIGERFGHNVGDQAVRDMAEVLRESFRDSDLVARFDEDEFTVLACMPPVETQAVKQRVLARLAQRNASDSRVFQLGASIGIVEHVMGEKIAALVARAQEAMQLDRRARER